MSMDVLWAPWRMQYISRVDKNGGCFLCTAAAPGDDRERYVLWRSETCFAVLNRWPYNNGHLLIAPNAHKADLTDLTDAELADQMAMLKRCERNLRRAVSPDGFNVGLNLGRVAGAGLRDHLHWHVVPRWNGDTNFMPVTASSKIIPQSLEALWELLRRSNGTR